MQRCLPSDSWGWKATAFRMLNIYSYHFHQNMNLHKEEPDADYVEKVCLLHCVFEENRKIEHRQRHTLDIRLKILP